MVACLYHKTMRMIETPARLRRAHFLALFCIVASLSVPSFVYAQEGIVFSHLTMSQGLSQGTVVCMLQDRQGFMWFGTQEGLNRFDGYEFTVFKHSPADSTTLNESFVTTLAEDSSGTLFVGNMSTPDLLNRFDRRTETFSLVPKDSVDLRHAHIGSAFQFYQDPSGVRWSGSLGGGVTRFDPRTGTTTTYKHDPSDPGSLLDDRVYSVVGDRTGMIWMGTHEGLERFDPRTGKFVHYLHDEKNPRSLSDNWVWPILEDRTGVLWFGTYRGGLNRFDRATGTFTHFRNSATDPRSLGDDRSYSLYQDRSGMIWVGTSNGVDRFDPEGAFSALHQRSQKPEQSHQ